MYTCIITYVFNIEHKVHKTQPNAIIKCICTRTITANYKQSKQFYMYIVQILVVTRYLIHCNGNENCTTYNITINNLKAFKDILLYYIKY